MITPTSGYRTEGGGEIEDLKLLVIKPTVPKEISSTVFDSAESDYRYYKDLFVDCPNQLNFLGTDPVNGPLAVSIVLLDGTYKALIRSKDRNYRNEMKAEEIKKTWWRRILNLEPSTFDILRSICPVNLNVGNMKLITDPRLPQALLSLEDKQTVKGYKFGILLAQEGQQKEDDMFSNAGGQEEYEQFLDDIGERVELADWPNYRAGLDVKGSTTGKQSLYCNWKNNEIMFHVGTMLPHNPKDKQQLEKKRHIGNDYVVIVFQNCKTPFKPAILASKQIHAVIVVRPVTKPNKNGKIKRYYQLAVSTKDGVTSHLPEIPPNVLFARGKKFKKYFYTKLLNIERACYSAPVLSHKIVRARLTLLNSVLETFCVK